MTNAGERRVEIGGGVMDNKRLSKILGVNVSIKPQIDEPERFYARYRQHVIDIERDGRESFYIRVTAPNGCYVYDGWFKTVGRAPMERAISEALLGAAIRLK